MKGERQRVTVSRAGRRIEIWLSGRMSERRRLAHGKHDNRSEEPTAPAGTRGYRAAEPADKERLLRRNVRRLHTFRPTLGFVAHFLVFRERLEAVASNFREVGEGIFATSVRRDEAKTLRIIEPFNNTGIYNISLR
jgi:hypothetical protein